MPIIWLKKAPTRVIDEYGVELTVNDELSFRLPFAEYLEYLEDGLREMNEVALARQDKVTHLRQACPLPPDLRCR